MQIDLTKFTASERGRYAIDLPFETGDGWRAATDARCCVRVPSDVKERTPESPELKHVFPAADRMALPGVRVDPAVFGPWEDRPCPFCEGVGFGTVDCDDCGGKGTIGDQCERCGHCNECLECEGRGVNKASDVKCDGCDGKGIRFRNVELADRVVDGSRLRWLFVNLPNLQVIPGALAGNALAFRFDGGEAVLMGLSNPD